MKEKTIKAMITSINNIEYEIFQFGQLLKRYEKTDEEEYSDYVEMLYGIRYGIMLELKEKIKKLREELKQALEQNRLAAKFDIGFKP